MRILYLLASSEIGGGNRYLLTLWRTIRNRDVTISAICPREGPMVNACLEQDIGCDVVEYGHLEWRTSFTSLLQYFKWRRLLRQLRPDVIHANHALGARAIALPAWEAGIPIICHVHFHLSKEFIAWAFRYLPKPGWFIINSRALELEVQEPLRRACPRAGQSVVYNAVELDVFHSQNDESHQPLRVGIVANLLPVKGHLDFLSMARELTRREMEAEYWIIGKDTSNSGYQETLIEKAKEFGVMNKVRFFGYCDNIARILNCLDIVVLTSYLEPFGISLIEAMATEKPVVASRVGGIPEVVEDNVTGFLVSPGAPLEFADAVQRLLVDRKLCARMGQAGRRRVERFFSSRGHADHVLALYTKVRSV